MHACVCARMRETSPKRPNGHMLRGQTADICCTHTSHPSTLSLASLFQHPRVAPFPELIPAAATVANSSAIEYPRRSAQRDSPGSVFRERAKPVMTHRDWALATSQALLLTCTWGGCGVWRSCLSVTVSQVCLCAGEKKKERKLT